MQKFLQIVAFSLQSDWSNRPVFTEEKHPQAPDWTHFQFLSNHELFCLVACLWVLLLTPGYVVLGVIMLPFFILMTIAYCVAASLE